MTTDGTEIVPVWALATGDVRVPVVSLDGAMTTERLDELRGVLAVLAEHPIATLEMRPLPDGFDRRGGISLDAASPLAQGLSRLIGESARSSSAVKAAAAADETLYRMVIPKKFAAQMGQGLVGPMQSKAVEGGIRSQLMGRTGVVGAATFVPAGTTSAAGTAMTVAAPLVLMVVAAGASAAAEQRRQQALDRITLLLEQTAEQSLDDERSDLDGCKDSIDKATAILLDEGKLGVSLGLDSAVHAIGKALAAADRRLAKWQRSLDKLPDGLGVDIDDLTEVFVGIGDDGGPFRTHLELAALAIALKRRVIVLQAVEHAQLAEGNPLENFVRALRADERRLDALESSIADVMVRLSTLELARPRGLRPPVFTSGQVDRLLESANRIHMLGQDAVRAGRGGDVAIDITRRKDGSVVAFPAVPVA